MKVNAVTFDLDDTLVVVDNDRETILREAALSVGAPPLSREQYLRAHRSIDARRTREPIFEEILANEGIQDVDPAALTVAYRHRIGQNLRPVRGAEELLDRLQGQIPVGLITNGPAVSQWDKIERLGWTDRFDAIVISGLVGADKPDSIPFDTASERLGVDPDDITHFGDHLIQDVKGAIDAGFDAVQVVSADHDDEAGMTVARDQLVDTLTPRPAMSH